MNYKALIIDDEEGNREYLKTLLRTHCPSISEISEASSAKEGVLVAKSFQPDVVFLDIEMHGGSGFDFLNQLERIDFRIIFVTAYDAYALKAIKYSALDYLLKPVDPNELISAIKKLQDKTQERKGLEYLQYNLQNKEDRRVALPTQNEVIFVRLGDIIRLEAEANYTRVFFAGERSDSVLLSGNLGYFERLIQDSRFYRTHQSHLINRDHIWKYVKTEGGYFLMSDKSQVPVARMKKEEIKRFFF